MCKISCTIWTVWTFTIFSTLLTNIETLAILFYATCFATITSFPIGPFMAKVYWGSHYHFIDCLCSDFFKLLSIMAWLAITSLTKGALALRKKYLARNINNRVWDIWISYSYILVVYENEFLNNWVRIYVSFNLCNFLYSWV